ncbi:MAG: hypothetical protein JO360_06130, partial [Acidobacteria bacterium]|nr:hypothetical protein [Acidobacteriota bacterium]
MPQSTLSNTCRIILLLLISLPSFALAQKSRPPRKKLPPKSSSTKEATPAPTPTPAPPVPSGAARITWEGNQKIARYRLQIARDEAF